MARFDSSIWLRRTTGLPSAAVGMLALCTACGSARVGGPRYVNEPIVWAVDDQTDVPQKPHERKVYYVEAFALRQNVILPLTWSMDVPDSIPAQNVNALGEVPDSTWFQNRIGRGLVTPEDIAAGPGEHPRPSKDGPWMIKSAKPGGAAPGFLIEDARGDTFLIKFDVPDFPEIESAAEVIAQRLFWAMGYHVPQSEIDRIRPDRLVIGEGATMLDKKKEKVPMTQAYVDKELARGDRSSDGTYRVHVSKFLPGEPLGGYPDKGVRRDDPNDTVAHQHRRDLRGQYVLFGWLAHTDLKPDNRLDMWVEDPRDPARHFVMHYLLDFGKSMGSFATTVHDPRDTYTYRWDYEYFFKSLLAFGLWRRPWERWDARPHPAIGRFEVEHYEPGRFRSRHPYVPFWTMRPNDAVWATKIMLSLQPEHLRAAVEQGRYSDPAAEDIMVNILVGRQKKAARHFLQEVLPLGDFELRRRGEHWDLCTQDLWIQHGLGEDAPSEHRASVHDWHGESLRQARAVGVARDGTICIPSLPFGRTHDDYTIVGWFARRDGEGLPPVWTHIAKDPDTGRPRIIGVYRNEP